MNEDIEHRKKLRNLNVILLTIMLFGIFMTMAVSNTIAVSMQILSVCYFVAISIFLIWNIHQDNKA
ncbi:MAG: hypothetical protein KAR20_22920, partial [Candidatus Heimdallarchaeota archaeon]|nr:hypothetical protein [Candidatus Heimdallarchaeota archaeon]